MDLSEKRLNAEEIFNCLSDPNYVNGEATKEIANILKLGGNIDNIVSAPDDNFNNVISAYNTLCKSKEINYTNLYRHDDIIDTSAPHICLKIRPDYGGFDKYFVAVIFSKIILLFLVFKDKPKFLLALNCIALKIQAYTKEKTVPTIIYEKSKNNISYYEKYNPYPDSKIIRCYWEKTNLDGSRSFAGGLKPENNPLNFVLEYGIVEFKLCNISLETAFSCADAALDFCKYTQSFLKNNHYSNNANATTINSEYIQKAAKIVSEYIPKAAKIVSKKQREKIKTSTIILLIVLGIAATLLTIGFIFPIIFWIILPFYPY